MGLLKKEFVIKPTSLLTIEQILASSNTLLTSYQNATSNVKTDGKYVDYFFADIFDGRDSSIYRIFSEACGPVYNLTKNGNYFYYTLIDNSGNNVTDPSTLPSETVVKATTDYIEIDDPKLKETITIDLDPILFNSDEKVEFTDTLLTDLVLGNASALATITSKSNNIDAATMTYFVFNGLGMVQVDEAANEITTKTVSAQQYNSLVTSGYYEVEMGLTGRMANSPAAYVTKDVANNGNSIINTAKIINTESSGRTKIRTDIIESFKRTTKDFNLLLVNGKVLTYNGLVCVADSISTGTFTNLSGRPYKIYNIRFLNSYPIVRPTYGTRYIAVAEAEVLPYSKFLPSILSKLPDSKKMLIDTRIYKTILSSLFRKVFNHDVLYVHNHVLFDIERELAYITYSSTLYGDMYVAASFKFDSTINDFVIHELYDKVRIFRDTTEKAWFYNASRS